VAIARALALHPDILCFDEPTSALDPISTATVEDLFIELKKNYTLILVTHNMQQASRVSDKTAFFYMGELIEYNNTKKIFLNPDKEQTQNYITGRFS
jgi:phosphate transport system ATP-binding protein